MKRELAKKIILIDKTLPQNFNEDFFLKIFELHDTIHLLQTNGFYSSEFGKYGNRLLAILKRYIGLVDEIIKNFEKYQEIISKSIKKGREYTKYLKIDEYESIYFFQYLLDDLKDVHDRIIFSLSLGKKMTEKKITVTSLASYLGVNHSYISFTLFCRHQINKVIDVFSKVFGDDLKELSKEFMKEYTSVNEKKMSTQKPKIIKLIDFAKKLNEREVEILIQHAKLMSKAKSIK